MEPNAKPAVPRFYTNHANVYATPFDVVLEAGVKGSPGEELAVVCQLVMSPQMAKVVSQVLSESIRQWEAKHGEIRLSGQLMSGPAGGPKQQPS